MLVDIVVVDDENSLLVAPRNSTSPVLLLLRLLFDCTVGSRNDDDVKVLGLENFADGTILVVQKGCGNSRNPRAVLLPSMKRIPKLITASSDDTEPLKK